jgi:mannose-6-phosphate isomerase-like protein (cupin superfamily)
MRHIFIVCLVMLTLAAWPTFAQQPAATANAAAMKLFASSADVQALIAKAKAERKADQANFSQPIVGFAPYSANLEYRALVGPAAAHDKEAEMFFVVEGSGTLVTGGRIVMETRPNVDNRTGTAIEGGTPRRVGKGDFIMVPAGSPHWFSTIDGVLVLMSLHLPVAAPK